MPDRQMVALAGAVSMAVWISPPDGTVMVQLVDGGVGVGVGAGGDSVGAGVSAGGVGSGVGGGAVGGSVTVGMGTGVATGDGVGIGFAVGVSQMTRTAVCERFQVRRIFTGHVRRT